MTDNDLRKTLEETRAMVDVLTDLVYDAAIRIEVLRAVLEQNGFSRSDFERVFAETKERYASQLQPESADLRFEAILKYKQGDGGKKKH
jgi:hypothetical protein